MYKIFFEGNISKEEENIFLKSFEKGEKVGETNLLVIKDPDFSNLKFGRNLLAIINLGKELKKKAVEILTYNGIVIFQLEDVIEDITKADITKVDVKNNLIRQNSLVKNSTEKDHINNINLYKDSKSGRCNASPNCDKNDIKPSKYSEKEAFSSNSCNNDDNFKENTSSSNYNVSKSVLKQKNNSSIYLKAINSLCNNALNYIEKGNILTSYNFPDIEIKDSDIQNSNIKNLDASDTPEINRALLFTYEEPHPEMLGKALFANMNLLEVKGVTNGPYGYAIVTTLDTFKAVPKIDFVTRVRVLQDI